MELRAKDLKKIIRSENQKLLKDYDRIAEQRFMTRKDCLSIHVGKHSTKAINDKGNMGREKKRFWGALVGLITVISGAIITITTILIQYFFGK